MIPLAVLSDGSLAFTSFTIVLQQVSCGANSTLSLDSSSFLVTGFVLSSGCLFNVELLGGSSGTMF